MTITKLIRKCCTCRNHAVAASLMATLDQALPYKAMVRGDFDEA